RRLDEFEERTSRLALAAGMVGEGRESMTLVSPRSAMNTGGPYSPLRGDVETLKLQGDTIAEQLLEVEQAMADQEQKLSSTPTIAPVIGVVTDGFGNRRDPFTGKRAYHHGLDLSARRGTPIVAPADGVVGFAGRNGGMGRMIRISHGFGFLTVYGHLDKILVEPGQDVQRGEEIGHVGNTGRSTGSHLHYEVLKDGKFVNPLYYILDAY
ncbi:MAG: M23 family metallopeptidase, partial [Acidobacteriota bacterium]